MSETKTMTEQEILEIFKGEYDSVLRRYEREVEKYALKMNEDYEYFFRWYGGKMYKAQVNLKALREMRPMTYWDDLGKIKEWLEGYIRNIELALIEGSQYPTSTSLMQNAAEVFGREAQQMLRSELQRLLYVIEYKG